MIHGPGLLPGEAQVVLGSSGKEGSGTDNQVEVFEIHEPSIHDRESAGLEDEVVEPEYVVRTSAGDINVGGNRTAQIDPGMQLDSRFGSAEVGPGKECQRQIDGRRAQGIDRVLQVQPKGFARVKSPGSAHEAFGQILPKSPVPRFVGFGQGRSGYRFAKTGMIECFRLGVQTGGDVAQSLAPRQLGEGHADKLLATAKVPDARLGIVTLHQAVESLSVDQIEKLGQHKSAGIHAKKHERNSDASHPFSSITHSFYGHSKTSSFS